MENSIEVKYDSICAVTLRDIMRVTSNTNKISLKNFNADNDEHMFVLGLIMSCYGVLGSKNIEVDCSFSMRRKLNKKYGKHYPKFNKTDKKNTDTIDVVELLNKIKPYAVQLCGHTFLFSDIYKAYYEGDN